MLRSTFSSLREYLTPIKHSSTFEQSGEITPEEFVEAGDFLVYKFPTWSWGSASPSKRKAFLPADKQFLVTKHVPCKRRANAVTNSDTQTETVEEDWDYVGPQNEGGESADASSVEEERTYNIYITYSTSYRVPKLYLSGHSDAGIPLAPKIMFEDIVADYKDKTATIEPAPFADNLTLVMIHPCKHAKVMKLMLGRAQRADQADQDQADQANQTDQAEQAEDEWEQVAEGLRVDQYLVVFLKFMSSVIPTIEFDYTMSVL